MSFGIYANGELIGRCEFEHGDPPMGVVFGQLMPNPHYQMYQKNFHAGSEQSFVPQHDICLMVTTENGAILQPCSGVAIEDYTLLGFDEITVTLLGLDASVYEQWFAYHVLSDQTRFN
jgi:hypothetical protein